MSVKYSLTSFISDLENIKDDVKKTKNIKNINNLITILTTVNSSSMTDSLKSYVLRNTIYLHSEKSISPNQKFHFMFTGKLEDTSPIIKIFCEIFNTIGILSTDNVNILTSKNIIDKFEITSRDKITKYLENNNNSIFIVNNPHELIKELHGNIALKIIKEDMFNNNSQLIWIFTCQKEQFNELFEEIPELRRCFNFHLNVYD
jgi:hypothetical protein